MSIRSGTSFIIEPNILRIRERKKKSPSSCNHSCLHVLPAGPVLWVYLYAVVAMADVQRCICFLCIFIFFFCVLKINLYRGK